MKKVSVIIPCRNEESTILMLLEALYDQTFDRKKFEVVIADGFSQDSTRSVIADFQNRHMDLQLRVIDNPKKIIPAGLNLALKAAEGSIIVRLDAHSVPKPDYLEQSVRILEEGKADNVGGRWLIEPGGTTWMAHAIAAAAANPIGVGDAFYRYSDKPAVVDTVPFGAYYKEKVISLGGYDESLLTNEDYDLNARIRKAGGKVCFDPIIQSKYFARKTLGELAAQYYRYGYWKLQMLRKYPDTIRWRQALPPVFVGSLLVLGLIALFVKFAWIFLAAEIFVYTLVVFIFCILHARKLESAKLIAGEVMSVMTMHFCWGFGFLAGAFHRI